MLGPRCAWLAGTPLRAPPGGTPADPLTRPGCILPRIVLQECQEELEGSADQLLFRRGVESGRDPEHVSLDELTAAFPPTRVPPRRKLADQVGVRAGAGSGPGETRCGETVACRYEGPSMLAARAGSWHMALAPAGPASGAERVGAGGEEQLKVWFGRALCMPRRT